MEKMLGELTLLSPPSTTPLGGNSQGDEGEGESESGSSLDSLALMKKQLMETVEETKGALLDAAAMNTGNEGMESLEQNSASTTTAISIEPPTPTTGVGQTLTTDRTNPQPLTSGTATRGMDSLLTTTTDSVRSGLRGEEEEDEELLPSTRSGRDEGSRAKSRSPCFSPASLHNSPSTNSTVRS